MMDDSPAKFIHLPQKPCVISRFEAPHNRFIIGTYELIKRTADIDARTSSDYLDTINSRAGKLLLIGADHVIPNCRVEFDMDCKLGGAVFDLKVRRGDSNGPYLIHVAHANGTVGIYHVDFESKDTISHQKQIPVTAKDILLTSIDYFQNTDSDIVVGDSVGSIHFLSIDDEASSPRHVEVAKNKDSIWCVKCLHVKEKDLNLVIVGAEDSSWYVYNSQSHLLFRNSSDFQAGVTSILPVKRDDKSFSLAIGSYDESIQFYEVELSDSNTLNVHHKQKLTIPGGGIWSMRYYKERELFLISAMYDGSYAFKSSWFPHKIKSSSKIQVGEINFVEHPLHYDVDIIGSTCCIVDFNNRMCILRNINSVK